MPDDRNAVGVDARLMDSPIEGDKDVFCELKQRIVALRAPTPAIVERQAVPPRIAQAVGHIKVLLDAGKSMEEQRGRPRSVSCSSIEHAEEAAAVGLKCDAVEACCEDGQRVTSLEN